MHTPILNNIFKRQKVYSYNCGDLNIKHYNNMTLLLFREDGIFANPFLTGICRSFTQKRRIPFWAAGYVSRSVL